MGPNIFYHGRNYISAFGICEDPVPFLPGGCIVGKCVLSAGVTDCCDCRSSCSCPGRIQGSGKCADLFHWFCIRCFCRNENYLYLAVGMIGGGAASYLAYLLFDHVRVRVLAWQDPWKYIDSKGYQITQSLFAIGSGSWFGMGLLKGNPTAIPYVEADFIFSSICEELGVIFGMCLILICISSFLEMMRISVQIHDRFYQLIVYGIGIMYIFQIFLTVGGGTKFIPLTGVTLPFISYGGSSVMTTMIMFSLYREFTSGFKRKVSAEVAENKKRKSQTYGKPAGDLDLCRCSRCAVSVSVSLSGTFCGHE